MLTNWAPGAAKAGGDGGINEEIELQSLGTEMEIYRDRRRSFGVERFWPSSLGQAQPHGGDAD